MKVVINLASEPFRHDRAKLLATALCAVLLLGLFTVQVMLILGERARAAENRERVARLNAEMAEIRVGQANADTTIQQPVNAEVLERSVLLNSLVQRKAISWSRMFADIEQLLPDKVRLIQVRL